MLDLEPMIRLGKDHRGGKAIPVWRVRMKAKSVSGTWKWRRPTAWGLAILCVLAVIEGILLYCLFFPDPSVPDEQTILTAASFVVGSLLLICVSILLTEKSSV
jgi:hypothetical protein